MAKVASKLRGETQAKNKSMINDGTDTHMSSRDDETCPAEFFCCCFIPLGSRKIRSRNEDGRREREGSRQRMGDVFDDVGRTCSEMVSARLSRERFVEVNQPTFHFFAVVFFLFVPHMERWKTAYARHYGGENCG